MHLQKIFPLWRQAGNNNHYMYKMAKQNISDIFSHPGSFIPTLGRHCTALNCTTTLELLLSYFRDLTKRRKIKRQKSFTIVMSGKFQTPAMF